MSFIKKSIYGLAGVVACLGLSAVSANAQQARFTLPVEAHWGQAVLEPGEYTVRFPNGVQAMPLVQLTGNGQSYSVLLQSRNDADGNGDTGKLILQDVDGTYVVSSISNPLTQVAYTFARPKIHERPAATASAHHSAHVAVEIKKVGQ